MMARAAVATRTTEAEAAKTSGSRGREVGGIVLLGIALFTGLSLCSFQFGAGSLMGPVGGAAANAVYAGLGVGGYVAVWVMGFVALRCLVGGSLRPSWTVGAAFAGAFGLVVAIHLLFGTHRLHGHAPGGVVGEYAAELLTSLFGRAGTAIIATVTLLCAAILVTSLSLKGITELCVRAMKSAATFAWESVRAIFPEHSDADDANEEDEDEEDEPASERRLVDEPRASKKRRDDTQDEDLEDLDAPAAPVVAAMPVIIAAEKKAIRKKRSDDARRVALTEASSMFEGDGRSVDAEIALDQLDAPIAMLPAAVPAPMIVQAPPPAKKAVAVKELKEKATFIPAAGGYHLPSLDLLDYEEPGETSGLDKQSMLSLAERLQKTLGDYGVKGQVVQIHPGPVVTMYEFVPVAGTKLSKISSLSNDLAMSLEAMSVRIVAPIPGRGSCGIEVPNKTRAKVYLKEILADEGVNKAKSKLTMGLGKDISGAPVAVDLARMPHLLVAGTTGSGKSVSVNGMICSLLFNATPEEVRMIMIDPKMVELSIYEGIPHLLLPVVTDPKKANLALKWAVDEMERRYELVSKSGVRDLVSYNKKLEKQIAETAEVVDRKIIISLDHGDGSTREIEVEADEQAVIDAGGVVDREVRDDISAARAANEKAREKAAEPPPRKLPYIVVVIDEFADLMMVAPKDVETSVARIAQKARAVGIHLILATQRPSVDVITGLIKANFPSRIAFQVASKIDSRTVLDQSGAESLLGQGDSLFSDRGAPLRRIHGALVTEEEIKGMVDFLKTQGQPIYDLDILKPRGDEDEDGELSIDGDENKDEMYDQAVRLVCETRMASVSMIQRRLQVGFNRAARMVEQMEKEGIVGGSNGSKPREVLAQAM
ncbi:MAG: DNA translocase FtsK 4TM domain-containing protein [Polyangia bacterium]